MISGEGVVLYIDNDSQVDVKKKKDYIDKKIRKGFKIVKELKLNSRFDKIQLSK